MVVYCDHDECAHYKEGECNNTTFHGNHIIWIGTNQQGEPVCTDYEERE